MINLTISEAMTAADGQLVHCEDPAYIGDMFIEGITLTFRFRRSLLKTACAQCSALQATYAKRAA